MSRVWTIISSAFVVTCVAYAQPVAAQWGDGSSSGGSNNWMGFVETMVQDGVGLAEGLGGGYNNGGNNNGWWGNGGSGNGYYYPSYNYYPQSGYYANSYAPPPAAPYPNAAPPAAPQPPAPKANVLPIAVTPAKNTLQSLALNSVTAADIHDFNDQAKQKVNGDVAALQKFVPKGGKLQTMLDDAGLPPDAAKQAKQMIAAGDVEGLNELLQGNNVAPKDANDLLSVAQARQALQSFQDKATQGTATNTDVAQVVAALRPYVPAAGANDADTALGDALTSSKLINALNFAHPGKNPLAGAGGLVFLVPGLAQGTVYPLGNGAVLAGGNLPLGSSIALARGPVAQAVGLPVGSGRPLPPSGAQTPVTSGVLLTNDATTAVNYTINGTHYTLQPTYTQTLPDGTTWTIAFDKGASGGTARYTLGSGSYAFTANSQGWQLYKKTFKAVLDNTAGVWDFNYVYGNEQQTLPAGQKQELTGSYPIVVRFDNGAGQTVQRRLENGAAKVALGPGGNALDLFAATDDAMAPAATEEKVTAFAASSGRPSLFSPAVASSGTGIRLFGDGQPALAPATIGAASE